MTARPHFLPRATAPAPRRLLRSAFAPARLGLVAFLLSAAAFFLLPLFVMVVTSLKSMDEIRSGSIFALPLAPTLQPWVEAWSSACTGLDCSGLRVGFWNSVQIALPSIAVSVLIGAVNGYALSMWKPRYGDLAFGILMVGIFVPAQVMLLPLVRMLSSVGLYGSLPALMLVHTVFGMPVLTLLFRNHFAGLPDELFKAARIDGGGFWRIFFSVMLPLARPMLAVAAILQVTGIWNDYLFGLVFGSADTLPMTVQLNNIVGSSYGERAYNVNMAATLLTSGVPLLVYALSGRWFVRGIAAGAVKG